MCIQCYHVFITVCCNDATLQSVNIASAGEGRPLLASAILQNISWKLVNITKPNIFPLGKMNGLDEASHW